MGPHGTVGYGHVTGNAGNKEVAAYQGGWVLATASLVAGVRASLTTHWWPAFSWRSGPRSGRSKCLPTVER
jgi:hypothetical protein